jgi:hypothetical protein
MTARLFGFMAPFVPGAAAPGLVNVGSREPPLPLR